MVLNQVVTIHCLYDLKAQHSETKIMASGPITSWQIDGEKMERVKDFIVLGSKITERAARAAELQLCAQAR